MTTSKVITDNILVAIASVSVFVAMHILFKTPLNLQFIILVLAMTFAEYFYDRSKEISRKKITGLIIRSATIVMLTSLPVIMILFINIKAAILVTIIVLSGVFYPIFLKNLTRRIVGFKDMFVPAIWCLISFLYLAYFSVEASIGILLFVVLVFIRDVVNVSYCDIKDMQQDKHQMLRTFANYFPRDRLFKFFKALNLISIFLIIASVVFSIFPAISLVLVFPVMISYYLIQDSRKSHNFTKAYIDSEYIIWAILLILVSIVLSVRA